MYDKKLNEKFDHFGNQKSEEVVKLICWAINLQCQKYNYKIKFLEVSFGSTKCPKLQINYKKTYFNHYNNKKL